MDVKTNVKTFGQKASYTDSCLATAFNDPNLHTAFTFQSQIPHSFQVMSCQIIGLSQMFCITLYNMLIICGHELLTIQSLFSWMLPLLVVHDCLW